MTRTRHALLVTLALIFSVFGALFVMINAAAPPPTLGSGPVVANSRAQLYNVTISIATDDNLLLVAVSKGGCDIQGGTLSYLRANGFNLAWDGNSGEPDPRGAVGQQSDFGNVSIAYMLNPPSGNVVVEIQWNNVCQNGGYTRVFAAYTFKGVDTSNPITDGGKGNGATGPGATIVSSFTAPNSTQLGVFVMGQSQNTSDTGASTLGTPTGPNPAWGYIPNTPGIQCGAGDGTDPYRECHEGGIIPQGVASVSAALNQSSSKVGFRWTEVNINGPRTPVVTTFAATSVQANRATLNGNLSDLGSSGSVKVYFDWGDTVNLGNRTPNQTASVQSNFSATLFNLNQATMYFFRSHAENQTDPTVNGTGAILNFTTLDPLKDLKNIGMPFIFFALLVTGLYFAWVVRNWTSRFK